MLARRWARDGTGREVCADEIIDLMPRRMVKHDGARPIYRNTIDQIKSENEMKWNEMQH